MKLFNTLLILSTSTTILFTGCDQDSNDEVDDSEIAGGKADESPEADFSDDELYEAAQACLDDLDDGAEEPLACDTVVDLSDEDEDEDKWADYVGYANCSTACVVNGWNLTVVGGVARGQGDSQEEANYSARLAAEDALATAWNNNCEFGHTINWNLVWCVNSYE